MTGIAHRFRAAHDADRTAVIDDGHVAELGGHDEPLAGDRSRARPWRGRHCTASGKET